LSLWARPLLVRWNSPGWPVIGFSSMYSSPYANDRLKESSSSRESIKALLAACAFFVARASDFGVVSLLACIDRASVFAFVEGAEKYVWPVEGVNLVTSAALETNLSRFVKTESCKDQT
jgi:hypothetical protein